MKLRHHVIACAIGMVCLLLPSCNSEDPSAMREGQKTLAEALAKNSRLEAEIANLKAELDKEVPRLKAELDEAKSKIKSSEPVKMPGVSEIERSLDLEGSKLKEEARQQVQGATVESFSTADLTIPSFERPFSCKAKAVLKEANGTRRTLYWTGSANLKGEWKFTKSDNWEPKPVAVEPPKVAAGDSSRVSLSDPEPPGGAKDNPAPIPQPVRPPPVKPPPEKPKPAYDIPLDRPVMGPGSR
ncbi:MAG: hypothetical protein WCP45_03755 [Verrucomicrobiota bacterium]